MIRPVLLVAFTMISVVVCAVDKDSTVRWNELIYASPAEQQIVKAFLKENSNDYLKVFLGNAPDPDDSYKRFSERINTAINDIQNSGQLKKRNDKKIKYIEELVRTRFLTHYEAMASFFEIMVNGNYNSLTATALYACIFEKLSIPYRIVEDPATVYLVAYPADEKIKITTTGKAIVFQYRIYPHEFQEEFINFLLAKKTISQDEIDGGRIDDLFKEHFFKDDSISLVELAGKHYMHDAFHRLDDKDVSSAYAQMLKGYVLYPSSKCEYGVLILTSLMLSEPNLNPLTRAALLGRATRFNKLGITQDEITGRFRQLSEEVLFRYSDRPSFIKCRDAITSQTSDKAIIDDINCIYYTESGRAYYNLGKFALAKPELVRAMDLQPQDDFINSIFISALSASFYGVRNSRMVVDTLEFYKARYPVLEDKKDFQGMLVNAYTFDVATSYAKNDVQRAEKYRQLFEDLVTRKSVEIKDKNIVGFAYSEAAAYYFRKGQKVKAKALLDRGLELAPESSELQQRRKMIN